MIKIKDDKQVWFDKDLHKELKIRAINKDRTMKEELERILRVEFNIHDK